MKKMTALMTAAMVALSTLTGTFAHAESGSLVVLGDSITTGYGLDGYTAGDNSSAAGSFANQLAAGYAEYDNFAVDGRTSAGLLTALEDENVSAALSGADTVVISIGGNDFLQPILTALKNAAADNMDLFENISGLSDGSALMEGADIQSMLSGALSENGDLSQAIMKITQTIIDAANSVDVSGVVENIGSILADVKSASPDAQVIILTVYDPFEGVTGMEMLDVVAREKLSELNSGIVAAAAENGAETADVAAAFKGHALEYTNIASMDIHPNSTGHNVIYSLLADIAGVPASPANAEVTPGTPSKGSPDTGAEGVAVFAGTALLAGMAALASRRR